MPNCFILYCLKLSFKNNALFLWFAEKKEAFWAFESVVMGELEPSLFFQKHMPGFTPIQSATFNFNEHSPFCVEQNVRALTF